MRRERTLQRIVTAIKSSTASSCARVAQHSRLARIVFPVILHYVVYLSSIQIESVKIAGSDARQDQRLIVVRQPGKEIVLRLRRTQVIEIGDFLFRSRWHGQTHDRLVFSKKRMHIQRVAIS